MLGLLSSLFTVQRGGLLILFGGLAIGLLILIVRALPAIVGTTKLAAYGLYYLVVPEFPKRAYDISPIVIGLAIVQVLPIIFWYDGVSLSLASRYTAYPAAVQGTPKVGPRRFPAEGEPDENILATYFYDGAICEEYADTWVDAEHYTSETILATNPRDSSTTIPVRVYKLPERAINEPQPWGKTCVRVASGSTIGKLASWRSFVGWFLNFKLVSWVVGILFFLVLTYLVIVSLFAPLAFWRGLSVATRAFRVYHSKKWIPPQGVGQPVLMQISDIHLTRAHVPYEITRQRSLWRGSMDTRQRFETLLHTIRSIDVPSTLLITGDLTDLGTPNEWADFEQTLRRLRKGESSLLLMAGNHDVSINTHWAPDTFRTKRTTRENACLEVLKKFDDSHWTPSFDSCDTFEDAFPRQTTIDLDTASVRVFALDSNRYRSGFVNSNAVGEFGRSQLSKFRDLLFAGTGPVIVATHHHITKAHDAPRWGTAAALGLFLIAIDARKLIAVLLDYVAAHASNTILLIHGHKHQQLFERYGDGEREIFIYGHPSSTMGIDNSVSLDGIIRFAVIGFSSAQGWTIDTKIVPGPAAGGIVQGTRII